MCTIFRGLGLIVAVAAAGCSQSNVITPAPGPSHQPYATESIVYPFAAGQSRDVRNGANPQSAVLDVAGTLYGTTPVQYPTECCGLVYAFALGGAFRVVHRFAGDGSTYPYGALVAVGDRLWGTTQNSAVGLCCGSVFAVDPTGRKPIESYAFKGGRSDGAYPHAGLVYLNHKLYGTTINGGLGCGAIGCGTVFELNPANGAERLIYRFSGSDGAYPYGGLIAIGGTLYGMTHDGGDACPGKGCGTVFAVTPDDKLELLHRFKGGANDGAHPYGALLAYGGKLWGTTVNGGPHCTSSCGTVFSLDLSGKVTSFYAFKGYADGAYPTGGLVEMNGTLYGTTTHGGGCGGSGCGTVFSVNPATGDESVVYAFKGGSDGVRPSSTLIDISGALYGTTVQGGGGCSHGCGTIFSVTP